MEAQQCCNVACRSITEISANPKARNGNPPGVHVLAQMKTSVKEGLWLVYNFLQN